VSGSRVTLDMLGELILNMQTDLQVVSAAMLRLDRSIERLERDLRHENPGPAQRNAGRTRRDARNPR
jgi:hypothetical protein